MHRPGDRLWLTVRYLLFMAWGAVLGLATAIVAHHTELFGRR